jgi:prolyl oligopeptidase
MFTFRANNSPSIETNEHQLSNGNIAVVHSINVHDEISIYSARGEFLSSISTSVLTVLAIEPLFTSGATNDLFILESVFYSPPTLHITTASNTTRELPLFGSKAGPSDFTTRQVFYPSLDKVEIPMFITHQTSKPITSKTPVLLYVYGGFGISLIPHFRPDFLAFMTSFRGVLACANIRGGGEKGHAWYTAAQKSNRQVLFNDIIYAVQYIKTNLGTDNVILMGESMGGLNVCSTMVQQPNLFKGVIANVGVLDVLRRKRLGLRDRGAADIGDVDIPEEFDDLLKWAPLENVKRGVRYPPVMLTTGAQDDLVPALHSVKMAATLQWAAEGVAGEEERGDVSLIVASEGSGHGFNNSAQVKTEASVARWGWVKRAVGLETIFDG